MSFLFKLEKDGLDVIEELRGLVSGERSVCYVLKGFFQGGTWTGVACLGSNRKICAD